MGSPRSVVLLGATGSIGRQALDVIRRHPDRFVLTGIAAGGSDTAGLAATALEFGVRTVAVARASVVEDLQLALYAVARDRGWSAGDYALPTILAGPDAATELAAGPCDVVLNGMGGSLGLGPSLAAIDAGHVLALANKESLVAGGSLVTKRARPGQIVPVDSEHSALAQCLRGGRADEVRRLVLTASGGPFRGWSPERMAGVTVEQALAHPTWDMGPVITINCATLVNKALELIEAHLLFGVPTELIDVVVHPQSAVHSMVEFHDGSTLAQCSPPDMRLPIADALSWPDRLPGVVPAVDWSRSHTWTFEPLDEVAFPAIRLARAAVALGEPGPAVFNAANEELVAGFLAGSVGFGTIVPTVARVLDDLKAVGHSADAAVRLGPPADADAVRAAERWARRRARELRGLPEPAEAEDADATDRTDDTARQTVRNEGGPVA